MRKRLRVHTRRCTPSTARIPTGYQIQAYRKGALVLHMFRKILEAMAPEGQDPFRAVMHDFLTAYRGDRHHLICSEKPSTRRERFRPVDSLPPRCEWGLPSHRRPKTLTSAFPPRD